MTDLMSSIIKQHVTEVSNKEKPVKKKIYWLYTKHCEEAKWIIQTDGKLAWRCDHEV